MLKEHEFEYNDKVYNVVQPPKDLEQTLPLDRWELWETVKGKTKLIATAIIREGKIWISQSELAKHLECSASTMSRAATLNRRERATSSGGPVRSAAYVEAEQIVEWMMGRAASVDGDKVGDEWKRMVPVRSAFRPNPTAVAPILTVESTHQVAVKIEDADAEDFLRQLVVPDLRSEVVWTLSTAEVAQLYECTPENIRYHKSQLDDELVDGIHFTSRIETDEAGVGNPNAAGGTRWTKRGFIRLGFCIKTPRAKRLRDYAESLIVGNIDRKVAATTEMSELLTAITTLAAAIAPLQALHGRVDTLDTRISNAPVPPTPQDVEGLVHEQLKTELHLKDYRVPAPKRAAAGDVPAQFYGMIKVPSGFKNTGMEFPATLASWYGKNSQPSSENYNLWMNHNGILMRWMSSKHTTEADRELADYSNGWFIPSSCEMLQFEGAYGFNFRTVEEHTGGRPIIALEYFLSPVALGRVRDLWVTQFRSGELIEQFKVIRDQKRKVLTA